MKTQSDKEAIIKILREFIYKNEVGEVYGYNEAATMILREFSRQKEAEAVAMEDVLFFAEYFRNNFEYYDCNANGNVYKWSDLSKRTQPAMSMKQIFEYWKTL